MGKIATMERQNKQSLISLFLLLQRNIISIKLQSRQIDRKINFTTSKAMVIRSSVMLVDNNKNKQHSVHATSPKLQSITVGIFCVLYIVLWYRLESWYEGFVVEGGGGSPRQSSQSPILSDPVMNCKLNGRQRYITDKVLEWSG